MLLPFITIEVCVSACSYVHQVMCSTPNMQTFIGYLQCAKHYSLYKSSRLMALRISSVDFISILVFICLLYYLPL